MVMHLNKDTTTTMVITTMEDLSTMNLLKLKLIIMVLQRRLGNHPHQNMNHLHRMLRILSKVQKEAVLDTMLIHLRPLMAMPLLLVHHRTCRALSRNKAMTIGYRREGDDIST